MAKLKDIKNRIGAVSKTWKITRTMEMVSTSKMKRWQNVVLSGRPYSEALAEVLRQLRSSPAATSHPLMAKRDPVKKAAILFLSSNRGLCGSFNTNVCKKARSLYNKYRSQGIEVKLLGIGKKGISFFSHQGIPLDYKDITFSDSFRAEETGNYTAELTKLLSEDFLSGEVDQVDVAYYRFISSGRQELVSEQFLPLTAPTGPEREARETDFIFEPSAEEIVNTILPLYAQNTFYRMVSENTVSEQAARRRAMKQATDNADEMITFLNRKYNRERQAQITRELTEIIGGSEALV
jgi:F-type H+-transporting ATPase subunit gamma